MRINNDNVVNAICIFAIVVSICFMLTVMLKSFYGEEINISFIKDIFSIGATLFAALIAISLFNDWKDQKKYEIVSSLAIEAHREFIYAKDKYMFFLFQHIYGTPDITYKEVDDDLFKVIAKLNLLDAILVRFQFGISINTEINNFYTDGYCKIPDYYRDVNDLKHFSENQLKMVFDKAFARDKELFKKLLDIIEKVEIKN
ncbi:hypothetical protein [Acinetobacter baumannii]|uniref:hypothetical protein n=1 Tax=Acinetobacter baumannii TaxID=470 RepID=UPI00355B2E0D